MDLTYSLIASLPEASPVAMASNNALRSLAIAVIQRDAYRLRPLFSGAKQLSIAGISASMRLQTASRSDFPHIKYVSPASSLPFRPARPHICRLDISMRSVTQQKTYSIAGPTSSCPIRAPFIMTLLAGRFTPAARLHVAMRTFKTFLSSGTRTVRGASWSWVIQSIHNDVWIRGR